MDKYREQIESFFIDKNERKELSAEELSPSGRYRLLLRYYKTKEGCWEYSRGTIFSTSSNEQVCDIKRNYHVFNHSFVEKDSQEWLITGRSYISQTIVNLDTGEEFEPDNNHYNGCGFCWSKAFLNPSGNILVVDGCYWATPYEFKFFDFSNPKNGWKELVVEPYRNIDSGEVEPSWIDDNTVVCINGEEFYLPLNKFFADLTDEEEDSEGDDELYDDKNLTYIPDVRLTLKRIEDKMIVIEEWLSDRRKKFLEEWNKLKEKENED